jgi:anion-transporting  ArsA/GET3 family ATPase
MIDIEVRNVNGLKRQREDDGNAAKRPRTASEEEEDEELHRVFNELQALQQKIHEVNYMLQNIISSVRACALQDASGRC